MTRDNRETMQRALGILEGAYFGASERVQEAIGTAVDMLDAVLQTEDTDDKG